MITLLTMESSMLSRVVVLLFLIYVFPSNNEFQVSARRTQYLAARHPWPNATIPYVIDCSIANVHDAKRIIKNAMAAWENKTCIRFVRRTNQKAYLLIRRQKGCWGQVGYRRKVTLLSMGDGCEFDYVMMHELGHTIGFYHEHQRADRNEFVEILWDNVMNSMWRQFYKRARKDHLDTKLPYDYSSIMHYKFDAFGKNYSIDTIALRDKNSTDKPTPYRYITDLDVRKTYEMYNCPQVEAKNNNSVDNSKKTEDEMEKKNEEKNKTAEIEIVEAVEVSLMSPAWYAAHYRERIASIMVNGKELARNRYGLNVVVFNSLSGKRSHSAIFSITNQPAVRRLSEFIRSISRRNYFLIVSKARSFRYLKEARNALNEIGIRLPSYIPRGSSICIVGYKGREDFPVKYVIGTPRQKASFLAMNITLPSDFTCQNDIPRCAYKAKRGYCKIRPDYYLKVCQKACGSCTEGKPCQDEHRSCGEWATNQYCRSNAEYMLIHCKVSCKVCRKALPARIKAKGNNAKRKIVLVDVNKKKVKKHLELGDDVGYNGVTGTRCSDKSTSCRDWARVGRCKSDNWVKKNCLLSCNVKGSCDREQVRPEGTCSRPFGLGWDRKVSDNKFTASSFYRIGEWNASADNARLYMEDDFKNYRIGSWCSKYPPKGGEWLQIDLGRRKRITAVATQGRFRYYEHVKTFKLSYSRDGKKWQYIEENGRDKEFKGNCDHVSPVLNIFDEAIHARYVKFHPIKYYEGVCMRVEIYGC